MVHSQWECYTHNGHVTFTMGMLHSQWARYIHNGHVTFQMGSLHSKWACYIPNGHVTFQMGSLHSKWACYIPNGHVTFQMGTLHSKWARYIPNGHVTSQMNFSQITAGILLSSAGRPQLLYMRTPSSPVIRRMWATCLFKWVSLHSKYIQAFCLNSLYVDALSGWLQSMDGALISPIVIVFVCDKNTCSLHANNTCA